MGTPIEGFFDGVDGVDIVAETMASTFATAQGVSVEVLIPSPKPNPIEESAQTERVGKSIPIPFEIPTPQKGVTLADASQIGSASPATPVIFANDPFASLSQVVKNGFSQVVTPSSIPSSAIRWLDADLSSHEGSEKVLEDSEDRPIMKKRCLI